MERLIGKLHLKLRPNGLHPKAVSLKKKKKFFPDAQIYTHAHTLI